MLPAAALGLILIVMLAGPKLFTRHMEAQPTPAAPKHAKAEPKSEARPPEVAAQPKQPAPLPVKAQPATATIKSEQPARVLTSASVQGEVLEQSLPEISEKARDSIQGTVRVAVRVQVDPAGHVTGAALDSPGPSKFFADKALASASRWKFLPPAVGGRKIPSEWMLHFYFSNSDTKVHASQATP
jgi:TonB family protein